jgi:hypothetical protein
MGNDVALVVVDQLVPVVGLLAGASFFYKKNNTKNN